MARNHLPDASLRGYLNGIAALASLCAKQAGRSEIGVDLYAQKTFPDAFFRGYRIRSGIVLKETPETFKQALAQWFGTDDPVTGHVQALFEHELGKPKRVLRAENEEALLNDLSSSERGFGAFYTTEDVFFVEFETLCVVFMMGNFD